MLQVVGTFSGRITLSLEVSHAKIKAILQPEKMLPRKHEKKNWWIDLDKCYF